MELRCGKCKHWLGESPEPVVYVETVANSSESQIPPPRDLRMCRSCQRLNVFVPLKALKALDSRLVTPVG